MKEGGGVQCPREERRSCGKIFIRAVNSGSSKAVLALSAGIQKSRIKGLLHASCIIPCCVFGCDLL